MSPAAGTLRLVHHHPGYLRVRADAFVDSEPDGPALSAPRAAAEDTPGFRRWAHNPKTGSVVLEYRPGALDPDELLERVAKAAGLRGVEPCAGRKRDREKLVSTLLDAVEGVNRAVLEVTDGRADLRELIPAALAVTSVVSFLLHERRGRLPSWDSALYRGYIVFMDWHARETRKREEAGAASAQ